jgi:hypothetical protein
MKKYILLVSVNSDGLSDKVSEHLEKGYQLHGNPFISSCAFCQAVVLVEKSDCNTGPR